MKLYKSGLALKREGADETVAAFHNEKDLEEFLFVLNDWQVMKEVLPSIVSQRNMAVKFFQEIADSSDSEMRDGDLARNLAEDFLDMECK